MPDEATKQPDDAAETSVEFTATFSRSLRLRAIGEAGIAAVKQARSYRTPHR